MGVVWLLDVSRETQRNQNLTPATSSPALSSGSVSFEVNATNSFVQCLRNTKTQFFTLHGCLGETFFVVHTPQSIKLNVGGLFTVGGSNTWATQVEALGQRLGLCHSKRWSLCFLTFILHSSVQSGRLKLGNCSNSRVASSTALLLSHSKAGEGPSCAEKKQ